MSGIAMALVLTAAFLHAGWNSLFKMSGNHHAFTWLFQLSALVLFSPIPFLLWPAEPISARGWACIAASGILHALYFWCMASAYARGDLSLVYPLARGSGPLFVPLFAVLLLGERLSAGGATGILIIVGGMYILHLRSFSLSALAEPFRALRGGASLWAMLTGIMIAAYSLVDKIGVDAVYPPLYLYLLMGVCFLCLAPPTWRTHGKDLASTWRRHWRAVLVVGFCSLFTYVLVLFAFRLSKVSYVVAVRESSILLSALFGILWLGERGGVQKIAGALLIVAGVVFVGVSR